MSGLEFLPHALNDELKENRPKEHSVAELLFWVLGYAGIQEITYCTRSADRVVTYTPFEKTRIRELQRAVPDLATDLAALEGKLLDLHPVVRNCVYHPDFRGSFSLKEILTPLVPELTYNDLVIVDGRAASEGAGKLIKAA